MKRIIFISFLIGLIGCSDDHYNSNAEIIGHGGMGMNSFYPWNSLESQIKALNLASTGIETDVRMTLDSVFVLFHSVSLESESDISGRVDEMLWSEIEGARYTYPYYTNYSIVRLENLFEVMKDFPGKRLVLDVKKPKWEVSNSKYYNTFNRNMNALLDEFAMHDQILIEFKDEKHLKSFKLSNPVVDIMSISDFEESLSIAIDNGLYGVDLDLRKTTQEQVDRVHEAGLKVICYNAVTPSENKKALEMGIDVIQTDNLEYIIRITDR